MATTNFASKFLCKMAAGVCVLTMAAGLAGCGAAQRIGDGASSVTKSVIFREIKELQLDLDARQAANTDAIGAALSTVVRVYQLRDTKSFEAAAYEQLLENDREVLNGDLVSRDELHLRPNESRSLTTLLAKDTRAVAVVALFADPDLQQDNWRLILSRTDLKYGKTLGMSLVEQQLVLHK